MLIVLGKIEVKSGELEDALAVSLKHVARSRTEDGCILHGVHQDVENSNSLVFVEKWRDGAALKQHFELAESKEFIQQLTPLLNAKPQMTIYHANELSPQELGT